MRMKLVNRIHRVFLWIVCYQTQRYMSFLLLSAYRSFQVENCLKKWYNDADEEFLIELAEFIKPSIRDLCRQITTTIMGEMASANQKEAKDLEKLFAVNYQNIQLFKIPTEQFPGQ
jgi:hypothetical protein